MKLDSLKLQKKLNHRAARNMTIRRYFSGSLEVEFDVKTSSRASQKDVDDILDQARMYAESGAALDAEIGYGGSVLTSKVRVQSIDRERNHIVLVGVLGGS